MRISLTIALLICLTLPTLGAADPDLSGIGLLCVEGAADQCVTTGTGCSTSRIAPVERSPAECASGSTCHWGQSWDVQGGYDGGNGTVNFSASCGNETLVHCSVSTEGPACNDGPKGPGREVFRCLYNITSGDPEKITGSCEDPADPTAIYLAINDRLPYVEQLVVATAESEQTRVFPSVGAPP